MSIIIIERKDGYVLFEDLGFTWRFSEEEFKEIVGDSNV